MKFLVDEMPNFYDDCPFSKEEWSDNRWMGICTLTNMECNLHEREGRCYGLKEVKGAEDE